MSRMGSVKHQDLEKVLKKLGFVKVRQKGSHSLWKHSDNRVVVISVHKSKDIKQGLLHKIITKEIGITVDDFLRILKQ
jgi:predicted RNA binding protein YcfA (HicA-like mRNA interferase family)